MPWFGMIIWQVYMIIFVVLIICSGIHVDSQTPVKSNWNKKKCDQIK